MKIQILNFNIEEGYKIVINKKSGVKLKILTPDLIKNICYLVACIYYRINSVNIIGRR